MEFVKEWEPEVARGKRTYSDARFVESIRKQLQTEKKAISQRQLDALLRIAARYRDRVPEVEAALTEVGYTETADAARGEPPDEASLRKLDLLKSVDLDASARRFVDSLSARAESGRRLTEAQVRALDRVILVHARAIPDFERVRADLGIQAELRVDDEASAELLGSLAHIEKWDPPVTRGRMVFDDHAFYSSLAQQFERKRFLSDRQKAALKRMIRRHRNVIPQYEALAAKHGLEKKAEGKETRQADAG
jgi:hypothetical protein